MSVSQAAPEFPLLRGRRIRTRIGWVLSIFAFVLVAAPLLDILILVAARGISAVSPQLFLTPTNGISGGLLNAIVGTFVLSGGALIIGVPIGVGGGIYLAEFGNGSFGTLVRFLSDVLTGIPSIVLGYFSYITMVIWLGWQFSALAGAITLALMVVPYMARLTELSLRQVPLSLREAGYALGAPERKVIFRIVLPPALPGVLTGALLALAISVGETAPLIYTAGWSNYVWNGKLTHEPIGYLTYVIWSFINQPFASAHALAFAAAFLVVLVVLVINVAARTLLFARAG
ncbi:MAG TPA: phosphate ABC transporter permease PstA [Acetobacteraceae bacterium]|nr:phosphate ABC transporter permease PstA [Acetobacteraceae bacterium]